jgi:serpin B
MTLMDFEGSPEPSRVAINDWVAARTEDHIQDLLPPMSISSLTRLVLANAIYFKAAWNEPFDEKNTQDGVFHRLDGNAATVPMMNQVATLQYAADTGWQAVAIPYEAEELAMVVIVPEDFPTFEGSFDAARLSAMLDALSEHQVTLALPKFGFESSFSLADALKQLGMVEAFTDAADLSGMNPSEALYISDVFHEAFIDVNEAGTEAAAATAVVVNTTSAPPSATLSVDRPFLFFIIDRPTGAVLFLGRVLDP